MTIIQKYNKLCERAIKNGYTLKDLSDEELELSITAKTIAFGRSEKDSIENAQFHMLNRERAEKIFSTTDPEKDIL